MSGTRVYAQLKSKVKHRLILNQTHPGTKLTLELKLRGGGLKEGGAPLPEVGADQLAQIGR